LKVRVLSRGRVNPVRDVSAPHPPDGPDKVVVRLSERLAKHDEVVVRVREDAIDVLQVVGA